MGYTLGIAVTLLYLKAQPWIQSEGLNLQMSSASRESVFSASRNPLQTPAASPPEHLRTMQVDLFHVSGMRLRNKHVDAGTKLYVHAIDIRPGGEVENCECSTPYY